MGFVPIRYDACGGCDGEEHFQKRKEGSPEDRREGQTLSLRQVPEEKSEARQNTGSLVLPELLEPKSA